MSSLQETLRGEVDEELKQGITRALMDHPNLFREKLQEMGVLDAEEIKTEGTVTLSPAEEAMLPVVKRLQNPKSAAELQTIIEEEEPDELAEYDSATHREWISTQLNKLARKGLIGKYRDGRSVRYTAEPIDAVRRWALRNNVFAEEIDATHVDEIVADTGMDRQAVLGAVSALPDD